jgi:hypothetical protein
MDCPKCGAAAPAGSLECPVCGVIFAKLAGGRPSLRIAPYVIEEERIADGRIGASEMKVLGFGLAAALAAYAIPFTRFVLSALVTLFHEFGHAVAGWIFGHASLPAFDLVYGGGITHYGQFRIPIAAAVGLGLLWLGWLFRENRVSLTIVAIVFALWLFVVTREWRREIVMASAGHLSESILAGILFYKALAGVGWRAPEFERPLGAFVAFFVQIHSMAFAWKLTHDAGFLDWYRQGKGGALMNDLEVIALDLQIWLGLSPGIEGVAKGLLLFSVVPFVVALVWYFERARWHRVLRALRTAHA